MSDPGSKPADEMPSDSAGRKRIRLGGTVLVVLAAACAVSIAAAYRLAEPCRAALPPHSRQAGTIFQGHLYSNFETAAFVPCGCDLDGNWWSGYSFVEGPLGPEISRNAVRPLNPYAPTLRIFLRFEGLYSPGFTNDPLDPGFGLITAIRSLEVDPRGECPRRQAPKHRFMESP